MIHEIEGFEQVNGFDRYLINREGLVWSILSGKFLKAQNNGIGYMQVTLLDYNTPDNKKSQLKVHRLMCLQFLPNPEGLTDVNHKNGIKADNRLENLEWISHSKNVKHSYDVLGRVHDSSYLGKKVKCSNGKIYDNAIAASKDTDCRASNISMCCNNKIRHTKQLKFQFA